jgi:phytoene dehydrogenase-like protein
MTGSGYYDADVIVVGAGLTGLRAALEVSRAGLTVLVVEKEDSVGGRVRTSVHDGFKLDHGFQVILSGYPELNLIKDTKQLRVGEFLQGARIRWGGAFYDLLDPRVALGSSLSLLRLPFASLWDLMQLARLSVFYREDDVRVDGRSTSDLIRSYRFSQKFKDAFLRPFLAGIFLDPTLSADASMARFYLKVFSEGPAVLPLDGMQALPQLLSEQIGPSHVLLQHEAISLSREGVVLESGEELRAKKVICALDALSAARLGSPEQTVPMHGVRTMYFAAESPPFTEPLLVLNGEGSGPINNLTVLSNVQRSYAPAGKALISLSVLGQQAQQSDQILLPMVLGQLHAWYGEQVSNWRFLRSFYIPGALPARPRLGAGWIEHKGVYFAGDYLSYGSQNGALRAGRRLALELVAEL